MCDKILGSVSAAITFPLAEVTVTAIDGCVELEAVTKNRSCFAISLTRQAAFVLAERLISASAKTVI